MALYHSPFIITNGLILYLDAANRRSYPGSGTNWFDLSGNGNNGTLTNGPTFTGSNSGSIAFDGTNDAILLPDVSVLEPSSTGTIAAWVKYNSLSNYGQIFTKRANSSGNSPFSIDLNGSNLPRFYLGNGSSTNQAVGSAISINNWYFFSGVWNGSSLVFSINGVIQTNVSQTINPQTGTGACSVGNVMNSAGVWGGSGAIAGTIPMVLYYNRALSMVEILQNFNATRGRFGV